MTWPNSATSGRFSLDLASSINLLQTLCSSDYLGSTHRSLQCVNSRRNFLSFCARSAHAAALPRQPVRSTPLRPHRSRSVHAHALKWLQSQCCACAALLQYAAFLRAYHKVYEIDEVDRRFQIFKAGPCALVLPADRVAAAVCCCAGQLGHDRATQRAGRCGRALLDYGRDSLCRLDSARYAEALS